MSWPIHRLAGWIHFHDLSTPIAKSYHCFFRRPDAALLSLARIVSWNRCTESIRNQRKGGIGRIGQTANVSVAIFSGFEAVGPASGPSLIDFVIRICRRPFRSGDNEDVFTLNIIWKRCLKSMPMPHCNPLPALWMEMRHCCRWQIVSARERFALRWKDPSFAEHALEPKCKRATQSWPESR